MTPYVEPTSLSDLWQLLSMLSIPAAILLTARYLNRRDDRLGRRVVERQPAAKPR